MSYTNIKTQLAAALANVTWSIPSSAAAIAQPTLNTSFRTIGVQQFAGEEAALTSDKLPYCRIWIPDLDEKRMTSGGGFGSEKQQLGAAHLFIYQVGLTKDWTGLSDYFDAVIDATMAYLRHNDAAPTPGPLGDQISGWGMHMRSRIDLPQQYGAELTFSAVIAVDVIGVVV